MQTKLLKTTARLALILSASLAMTACSDSADFVGGDPVVVSPPPAPPAPPPPAPPPPPPPPPPAPPPSTGGSPTFATPQSTSRFLSQATFGATSETVQPFVGTDVSEWLLSEFAKQSSSSVDNLAADAARADGATSFNFVVGNSTTYTFWRDAVSGDAQLRDRMAFALSQILVASTFGGELLSDIPQPMAYYQDVLKRNAFGNYRDLLEEVTYSPAMGHYLTYIGNQKADPVTGRMPDENYAREILQLFTVGLVELNLDGTPVTGANGQPVELYTNADITGLARVFTGLDLTGADRENPGFDEEEIIDEWLLPMSIFPEFHSTEAKSFLGTTISSGTDAATSIDAALDHIMEHPNVGPFVGRQLIQRFTTSNPDPDYVQRVAETFNRGTFRLPNGTVVGTGRKGDLSATISAILLDPDNQMADALSDDRFGKLREPVLRFTHWARVAGVDASRPEYTLELYDTTSPRDMNQHPYRARSVFNFYRPGYVAPGTQSGELGLTVPELQIVNAASTPGFMNFMTFMLSRSSDDLEIEEIREEFLEADYPFSENLARRSFIANYSRELGLATDPAALVESLNQEMAYGSLSAETIEGIISAVEGVPLDDDDDMEGLRLRVIFAFLMVLASPDYTVQR